MYFRKRSDANPSLYLPTGKIYLPTLSGIQPTWARRFGGEQYLYQLGRNMIDGNPNATILGTPVMSAAYVTFLGDNQNGLILPIVPVAGGSIAAFIVARCLTFNAATPLLAQLLGNLVTGTGGLQFKLALTGIYGFMGNTFNSTSETDLYTAYATAAAPNGWRAYFLQATVAPAGGGVSTLFIEDVTSGVPGKSATGATTAGFIGTAPMQLGSFDTNSAGTEGAPIDMAFAAVWQLPAPLAVTDITDPKRGVYALMQGPLASINGVTA